MKPIPLTLPVGSTIVGEILRNYRATPERLNQDILQVRLPNGIGIDVSWWPVFDPSGSFSVVVYRSQWNNQILLPIELRSTFEVAQLVEQLAAEYSPRFPSPSNAAKAITASDTTDVESQVIAHANSEMVLVAGAA